MNETVSSSIEDESPNDDVEWHEYVDAVRQFIDSLEKFLGLAPENSFNFNVHTNNSLIRKPNDYRSLFDFAARLVARFHRPKSLKQLARFKLREMLFERVEQHRSPPTKYNDTFLKRDNLCSLVRQLGLPNDLNNYILCKSLL